MEDLTGYLKQLGARHNIYQTESTDYAKVGGALLATLEVFCGDVWDEDVKQAWAEAFGVIQSMMEEGAREALAV